MAEEQQSTNLAIEIVAEVKQEEEKKEEVPEVPVQQEA